MNTNNNHNSILTNLFTTRFSLYEILFFLLPIVVLAGFVSILYKINDQLLKHATLISELKKDNLSLNKLIVEKNQQMEQILQNLHSLETSNKTLEQLIIEKNMQINRLLEPSSTNNLDVLMASNEMTQFWIKTGGVILIGGVAFYFLHNVFPAAFSVKALLKAILPSQGYSFLQDYTPFFQERVTYTYQDSNSGTDWIINILNNKYPEILVKTFSESDWCSLQDFLRKFALDAANAGIEHHLSLKTLEKFAKASKSVGTITDQISDTAISTIASTPEILPAADITASLVDTTTKFI